MSDDRTPMTRRAALGLLGSAGAALTLAAPLRRRRL